MTSKESIKSRDTHAVYQKDNSEAMHGLWVKLNFHFNGVGQCAPICITIYISCYEMPHCYFKVLEVEDLCIGGYIIHLSNKTLGYAFLMKNKRGAEKEQFR